MDAFDIDNLNNGDRIYDKDEEKGLCSSFCKLFA